MHCLSPANSWLWKPRSVVAHHPTAIWRNEIFQVVKFGHFVLHQPIDRFETWTKASTNALIHMKWWHREWFCSLESDVVITKSTTTTECFHSKQDKPRERPAPKKRNSAKAKWNMCHRMSYIYGSRYVQRSCYETSGLAFHRHNKWPKHKYWPFMILNISSRLFCMGWKGHVKREVKERLWDNNMPIGTKAIADKYPPSSVGIYSVRMRRVLCALRWQFVILWTIISHFFAYLSEWMSVQIGWD